MLKNQIYTAVLEDEDIRLFVSFELKPKKFPSLINPKMFQKFKQGLSNIKFQSILNAEKLVLNLKHTKLDITSQDNAYIITVYKKLKGFDGYELVDWALSDVFQHLSNIQGESDCFSLVHTSSSINKCELENIQSLLTSSSN